MASFLAVMLGALAGFAIVALYHLLGYFKGFDDNHR